MISFLVDETFDSLAGDDLDSLSMDDIDSETFQTITVQNVSHQVVNVIVADEPGTPFVQSTGLVNLQPGKNFVAELFRVDPAQIQQLQTYLLVRTARQAITVTT